MPHFIFPKIIKFYARREYTEKYLEWFLVSDERFLIGIEVDDKIVGVGGCLGTGSTSQMIQYSFSELLLSLFFKPWLFFHDKIINNISLIIKKYQAKIVTHGFPKEIYLSRSLNYLSMGLVIIGVHKNFQNKNLGKFLLHQFDKDVLSVAALKLI